LEQDGEKRQAWPIMGERVNWYSRMKNRMLLLAAWAESFAEQLLKRTKALRRRLPGSRWFGNDVDIPDSFNAVTIQAKKFSAQPFDSVADH
jgi:hypothetical protein